ncbi:Uncharacterized protein FWK35_00017198 [Aphis craccivora]|uniref:DUF4371 domain-containing protein n=1 Tax=Aphis craccivora TaxID=307492 RepID=A0A6G0YSB6_APHCR|nr:Uncharacterized protein FWK35_00017198 [Aphis craccivora]
MNRKTPYPQKFRPGMKNNSLLKDWIEEVEDKTLSTMSARIADLSAHAHTEKHLKSAEPFSCARQGKLPFQAISNDIKLKAATLEANMSLLVNSNTVADHVQLHRTKCTGILKNIIFPYFKSNLNEDIGSSVYSLLLDESTDISVVKQLGYALSSTLKLESGSAVSVVKALTESLLMYDLNILNMQGITCDNASVMVGQHSVSAAVSNSLPDYLEFLLAETYNWFAHLISRQLSYKLIYQHLNNGIDPLKIVRVSSTRWLSIEVAVSRVLDQWEVLKEHFKEAGHTDKCYKAKMLYKMYCDVNNQLYFIFLKPILSEAQHINKLFQSNTADRTKLLDDLVLFIGGLARKVVTPDCRANLLEVNIKNYLHPHPYLGYEFEAKCSSLKMRPEVEKFDCFNIFMA